MIRLCPLLLVACFEPQFGDDLKCGPGLTCPTDFVCVGTTCITVNCHAAEDGTPCTSRDQIAGTCRFGLCLRARCGDGVLDLELGEVCDDANNSPADGCGPQCNSREECGNGVVDYDEDCDDAEENRPIDHDGCSGRCRREIDNWRQVHPEVLVPRTGAGFAYDIYEGLGPSGGSIMFGGRTLAGAALGDTWRWNGTNWISLAPSASPSARHDMQMAFGDFNFLRIILFGGIDANGYATDTWLWDGDTWVDAMPATSPPGRTNAGFAYHYPTQKMVMVGGKSPDPRDDTWMFDRATNAWTQVAMAARPRPGAYVAWGERAGSDVVAVERASHETWLFDGTAWRRGAHDAPGEPATMGYDARYYPGPHDYVVLATCGFGPNTYRFDQGTENWIALDVSLPARCNGDYPIGTYDIESQNMLVFGGIPENSMIPSLGVHELDQSAEWKDRGDLQGPPARFGAAVAYEPERARIVVFGGTDGVRELDDTWQFDGKNWSTIVGPMGGLTPAARTGAAMTLLVGSGFKTLFMFGGSNTAETVFLADGYELLDNQWRPSAAGGEPPARTRAAMAYDVKNKRVVLFGGYDGDGARGDTWTRANVWTQLVGAGPQPSAGAAMVYDPEREIVVLFDGFGETWELEGDTWIRVFMDATMVSPPGRTGAQAGFDHARGTVVINGGIAGDQVLSDTWEFDGVIWTQRNGIDAFFARFDGAMGYDAIQHRIFMYGGRNPDGRVFDDLWTSSFETNGESAYESCTTFSDVDGDGLSGCTDPDCWGRCSPYCGPTTTTCDGLPKCGDFFCDKLETPVICPNDCH